jgi:hypothetical protein
MDARDEKMQTLLEKYAERTIEGNYALWNALLTMDSIIITVFTAALLYLDRGTQLVLAPSILLGIVSAGLLIANFRSSRDDFKYQGILAMGRATELSQEERKNDLTRARRRHDWRVWREGAVVIVTFVQGLFILVLVGFIIFRSHINGT